MAPGILESVSLNEHTGREGRSNHTQWSERNNYMRDKVTVPAIQARKGGPKIKVVRAIMSRRDLLTIRPDRELSEDAPALAAAGVFGIVLEGVPDVLAQMVTQEVPVPTIGIGAGPHCDGQVLVFHDVLGMYDGRVAKFVRQYAHLSDVATEALQRFFADVQAGTFPSDAESYHMDEESMRAFYALIRKEE